MQGEAKYALQRGSQRPKFTYPQDVGKHNLMHGNVDLRNWLTTLPLLLAVEWPASHYDFHSFGHLKREMSVGVARSAICRSCHAREATAKHARGQHWTCIHVNGCSGSMVRHRWRSNADWPQKQFEEHMGLRRVDAPRKLPTKATTMSTKKMHNNGGMRALGRVPLQN